MKKRLLALLLCLVMVIGLVPTVFAAEGEVNVKICYLGGGSDYTKSYAQGETVEKPADPNKPGYTWNGKWYLSHTEPTETNAIAEKEWDFTWTIGPDARDGYLFPGYTENTYKVVFNPNGGEGTMPDQTFPGSKGYTTLAKNAFTKTGYTFAGWGLSASSDAVTYSDNNCNVTTSEQDFFTQQADGTYLLTLYAIWKEKQSTPVEKFSITYYDAAAGKYSDVQVDKGTEITIDPNNGEAYYRTRTEREIKASTKLTVTEPATLTTATAAGKTSLGWKYDAATKTFTAVWEKESYRVSFYCYNHGKNDYIDVPYNTKLIIDPNYGTYAGSKATQTIYVTADRSIADASRTGYYFYGWYVTELNGVYTFTAIWDRGYYSTYSIYYYDFEDGKSEYANFPYGTSVVIDPNGGTAKLSGTSFSTKQSFNIYRDYTLTDASRSGYTFYGWDLTKSGSTYYFTAMWSRYKSDVPYMLNGTDHYAYIKGYPNGSFKPTDTITRAEAATIFYRLLTDSTRKAYATTYNSFKDVPATAWYNTAVSTMAKLGIVNGGADGYFRPNDPITRAEIAAMIARCDGAYYTGTSTVFSDTYGHWAAGYIDRAYELGWINGYGTTYAPDRYISRAETVAVLNRVLNRAPQYTSDLTRNYTTFSDVATSAWYYLDVEEAANSHTYTRKSNADYETWTKLIADPSWF